jgi:putative spermidine/putrescine transport system ATP-binding protein
MAIPSGHQLRLDGITQRFAEFVAVRDINLEVAGGELIALLGPSGCGKSTLLRIISGFVRQSEGQVLFDGQAVDHMSPSQRGVGIVFQNYALFPHMTVSENIAYGLQAHKWPRADIAHRVNAMLELVHMKEFAQRKPRQLSGGQQQRIALARCLAVGPKVLLLDEPFGALDKNLRLDMQIEVKRLQRESGITTILVTHDQEEALSMADRVAVMSRGRIEQVSAPTEIYDKPITLFVNEFVGSTNIMSGTLVREGDRACVMLAHSVGVDVGTDRSMRAGRVAVSIRPEQLCFVSEGGMSGIVKAVMPLGANVVYEIEVAPGLALKISQAREGKAVTHQIGELVSIAPRSVDACHVFPVS